MSVTWAFALEQEILFINFKLCVAVVGNKQFALLIDAPVAFTGVFALADFSFELDIPERTVGVTYLEFVTS